MDCQIPDDIDLYIDVRYTFESSLDAVENNRYLQQITGSILLKRDGTDEEREVGRLSGRKLLLGAATNNGYSHFSIFDISEDLMDIGEAIYDFENSDYKKEMWDLIGEANDADLIILDSIELLPDHRKKGLTEKAVKDYFNNFGNGTAYYLMSIIPNQRGMIEDTEWNEDLKYSEFARDLEKGSFKLMWMLSKISFKYFPIN